MKSVPLLVELASNKYLDSSNIGLRLNANTRNDAAHRQKLTIDQSNNIEVVEYHKSWADPNVTYECSN